MALALYRKYRPATFSEVVGQEHVTDPLRTALAAGRVNHAYLFSGPRGCGKTSSARIMARSLNCVQGPTPDPCGVCSSCIALAPEGPGSLDVVELDAASHGGVDDTRDLRDKAFYMPAESRYRVFIIDEAHMVSPQGFNALLKIVEEPPEHLVFIFATTEPDKVMTTIRSRTHHYPFRLIPPATLRKLLEKLCREEDVTVEPAVFPLVIRAGGGSARDSLSILDQLLAGAGPGGVTYASAVALLGVTDASLLDEMVDALAAGDGASVFGAVDKVVEAGHDPRRFAADLLQRLRDLVIIAAVPDAGPKGLIDAPEDQITAMYGQSDRLGASTLTRLADVMHTGLVDMRGTTSPRLVLELMCARMLLPATASGEGAMLQRLERLEKAMSAGGPLSGSATPAIAAGSDLTGAGGRGAAGSGGSVESGSGIKPAYRRPSLRSEAQTPGLTGSSTTAASAAAASAAVTSAAVTSAAVAGAAVAGAAKTSAAGSSDAEGSTDDGSTAEDVVASDVVASDVVAAEVAAAGVVAADSEDSAADAGTSASSEGEPLVAAISPAVEGRAADGPAVEGPAVEGPAAEPTAPATSTAASPEPVAPAPQPARSSARPAVSKAAALLGLPTPPVLSGAARARLSSPAAAAAGGGEGAAKSAGTKSLPATPVASSATEKSTVGHDPGSNEPASPTAALGADNSAAADNRPGGVASAKSHSAPVVEPLPGTPPPIGDAPSLQVAPPVGEPTSAPVKPTAPGSASPPSKATPAAVEATPAAAEIATTASNADDDWPAPPEPPMDEEDEFGPPDPISRPSPPSDTQPSSPTKRVAAPAREVSSVTTAVAEPIAPAENAAQSSPTPKIPAKVAPAASVPAAPPKVAPAAKNDGSLGVTDARRLWAEVLTAVQRRRRTTQILLESATVADVRDGALYLTMPSAGMARRVVESANADLLRQALQEVLGVDWAIRCDAAGDAPPSRPALRLVTNEPTKVAVGDEDDTPDEYNPHSPDPTVGQFAPRDPEEVAIELLKQELGATKID